MPDFENPNSPERVINGFDDLTPEELAEGQRILERGEAFRGEAFTGALLAEIAKKIKEKKDSE
ncbi:hypothetical protein A2223_04905 [Candidatus Falkowbacteria bacterium RIFOXYA2_FULL_35_8]|uniref:Uncharacterized protein n=1 Tax=Candidatus Falkowbacteria bacterium RIFOXYC2_FULL_36_12 TaxID=1798002 RepID=A0A1F5SY95_9BACT|nr:MAG: hypothetical protein A2478_04390 [Candidatus Falkowbacteria bacterium RIFOXYC2_FULL_36_12]OGF33176.1 MAG: hypothetical protein A2223_04905 [Candidatus Falkowbacteria bacterium RIFOXYA2_FULL_35_8]